MHLEKGLNIFLNLKAIYSYGHRNTQGMFYDIENNQIWTHEHGRLQFQLVF